METALRMGRPSSTADRCLRFASREGRAGTLTGDTRGTAAVEFGLVGLLFTAVLGCIVQIGVVLTVQTALDEATRVAARQIRTGAIGSSGASTFVALLCGKLSLLPGCSSSIQYNVVSGSTFASLSTAITTTGANRMSGTQFSPGTAGQDVVVQVGWTLPIFVPMVGSALGKAGTLLLVSTAAFQNEPF